MGVLRRLERKLICVTKEGWHVGKGVMHLWNTHTVSEPFLIPSYVQDSPGSLGLRPAFTCIAE